MIANKIQGKAAGTAMLARHPIEGPLAPAICRFTPKMLFDAKA